MGLFAEFPDFSAYCQGSYLDCDIWLGVLYFVDGGLGY